MFSILFILFSLIVVVAFCGFAKMIGNATGIKGKVGNQIYGTWKGVQVIKTMFIPSNPKSSAQTTVRTAFASIVDVGRYLVSDVVRKFWNPFAGSLTSGWANFMKENLNIMSGTFDIGNLIMSKGSLEVTGVTSATYNDSTGALKVDWNDTPITNGEDDDSICIVAYDSDTRKFVLISDAGTARSLGTLEVTIPTGLTAASVSVWIFAYAVDTNDVVLTVSDSEYIRASAAA